MFYYRNCNTLLFFEIWDRINIIGERYSIEIKLLVDFYLEVMNYVVF